MHAKGGAERKRREDRRGTKVEEREYKREAEASIWSSYK